MLQDQPHTFDVILGISPVAKRIQITQVQFVLFALCDTCGSKRNFTGNERLTTAFALVIEQNTVYSKHTIAFAVVFSNPETILFGYPIRRTGIEWSCLFLWNFLHLTEQFGSRSLIDAGFLFQSQDAYSFEHTQRTDSICFGSVFRNVERNLHVALSCEIVDFIRLHLLNNTN